jgi:hypothetical protein
LKNVANFSVYGDNLCFLCVVQKERMMWRFVYQSVCYVLQLEIRLMNVVEILYGKCALTFVLRI